MPAHFVFIDDAVGEQGDASRFCALLSEGPLRVTLAPPVREHLLVPENELRWQQIDGFILDINLRDQVPAEGVRFVGTGAGLAQDLRLLQATDGAEGQTPRPIVRLCAAQVFQKYLEGDNSTRDVFDLGFDKESLADNIGTTRGQIAALSDIYEGTREAGHRAEGASAILGLQDDLYSKLHSEFRTALEAEIERKVHEAANFLLSNLLLKPGLLVDEELLAVRFGVNRTASPGWQTLLQRLEATRYRGRGSEGFARWWMPSVHAYWVQVSAEPLYSMPAEARTQALAATGLQNLVALHEVAESPGVRPWIIARSDDPGLRLPADPRFGYPLAGSTKPWLDEPLWCLEQAKRQRRSLLMSNATRDRLARDLSLRAAAR